MGSHLIARHHADNGGHSATTLIIRIGMGALLCGVCGHPLVRATTSNEETLAACEQHIIDYHFGAPASSTVAARLGAGAVTLPQPQCGRVANRVSAETLPLIIANRIVQCSLCSVCLARTRLTMLQLLEATRTHLAAKHSEGTAAVLPFRPRRRGAPVIDLPSRRPGWFS